MKKQNENHIDKLFKDGMAGPEDHISFRDEDWAAMEQLLDERSKKRGVFYLFTLVASGIAAVLLLTLGWFYLNPASDYHKINKKEILSKASKRTGIGGRSEQQQQGHAIVKALPTNESRVASTHIVSPKSDSFFTLSAAVDGRLHTGNRNKKHAPAGDTNPQQTLAANGKVKSNHGNVINTSVAGNDNTSIAYTNGIMQSPVDNSIMQTLAANGITTVTDSNYLSATELKNISVLALNKPDTSIKSTKPQNKKKISASGFRPTFALAILTAPDVNGVGSFKDAKIGSNLGMQVSVQVKRWSITTGVGYAVKPYEADFGSYKHFNAWGSQPTSIYANCKVLDIPVNVNYQFYSKRRNSFSIGTGLSSYLMLHENYSFEYDFHAANSPYDIAVSNRYKNIFGVVNLNATYQRQMNSRFSLLVQPYYKIPLGKVGFTQSDLRSAGMAVGVNWNINPFKSK